MILFNKFYPFFNGWNIHINVEFKYSTIKRGGVFFLLLSSLNQPWVLKVYVLSSWLVHSVQWTFVCEVYSFHIQTG